MSEALTPEVAAQLRDAVGRVLHAVPAVPASAHAAVARLIDVLEASADAVIFPSDALISTSEAAALLGVSRMTVVRLIDSGRLRAQTSTTHRRVAVSDLARYRAETAARRSAAVAELAGDITETTPDDRVIATR